MLLLFGLSVGLPLDFMNKVEHKTKTSLIFHVSGA